MRFVPAFIAVLALSASAQRPAASPASYEGADREQVLLAGARKEGGPVAFYTSLTAEECAELAAAFDKRHGVKVSVWRASSEKVLQRTLTEARAGHPGVDVIETNGPELEALYRERALQPLRSPHQRDLLAQASRAHGHWIGTRINLFVQSYNTQLVRRDELPRRWADLAEARWKGRLGIEAEDHDWFMMAVKEQGEAAGLQAFRDIGRNSGFSVRKGHTLIAGLVASGEIAFALTTYSHGAEKLKRKGAPLEWFAIEPAIARANGVALPRSPAHPHAAALFADFILSPEGQAILERGGYVPANLKVPSPAQQLPLRFVDPALVLDEDAKWKKLYAEIVLGNAR